mgnify:CR=1 FL=1
MDREHQRNLTGIVAESARILREYWKLFLSLSSTLVLPLCFMILAHHLVSGPLIHKIRSDERFIESQEGSSAAEEKHESDLEGEWTRLLLFFASYLLFVLAFSLLSTAAIVYSVACMYTERSVSYTKVVSVVPMVWKRLLITFLWVFLIIAAYHFVSIFSIHMAVRWLADSNSFIFVSTLVALVSIFVSAHVYISCIWHLASVISVLEESFGISALKKSFHLIKGNQRLGFSLFFLYLISVGVVGLLFHAYVVHHHAHDEEDMGAHGSSLAGRVLLGALLVAILTFVTLFGMLAQTVFYFSCKAFHHEQIDWMALSEHLGAYMGEYVPLKSAIQMEPV